MEEPENLEVISGVDEIAGQMTYDEENQEENEEETLNTDLSDLEVKDEKPKAPNDVLETSKQSSNDQKDSVPDIDVNNMTFEESKIEKTIIQEGKSGDENTPLKKPKRFDLVKCHFRLERENGELVLETEEKEPFQTKIGDADLMPGMSLAIQSMQVGEKAKFIIPKELNFKDSREEIAKLEVHLLEVDASQKVTKWDLDDTEKLDFCLNLKEEGNNFIKQEKWSEAEEKYSQAIEIVEWDKSPRRRNLKVQCLYNISIALSKQGRYVTALERVSWAVNLRPEQAKGYFRRAQVYQASTEYEKAEKDLEKAIQIEPNNPDLLRYKKALREDQKKYQNASTKLYKNIFGKGVYETRSKCAYHDALNPIVEAKFRKNESMLNVQIELFSNILPDTVNYFQSLTSSNLIQSLLSFELKPENYILFEPENPVESEFEERSVENTATKIKSAGYLFFHPNEKAGNKIRHRIGLSLGPLPWMDGKWVPFGYVCGPCEWGEKLKEFYKGLEKEEELDGAGIWFQGFKET